MFVEYEKKGHIALLTMNRPDALNALNLDVLQDLDNAVTTAEKDEDIYVLIITGAGRSFVAGADIAQMKDLSAVQAQAFGEFGNSVFAKIDGLLKPVIAAVNGFALGGGCELAMACDIIIAGEKAKFGQPEVSLGITPGFGGTQRLPRIVGAAKAKELILTAKTIGAAEALSIGLVSSVVPQDELMDKAFELANMICANAQIAVRQSKAAINNGLQTDMATGIAFETQTFGLCFATEDQKSEMTAFVEKTERGIFKNK